MKMDSNSLKIYCLPAFGCNFRWRVQVETAKPLSSRRSAGLRDGNKSHRLYFILFGRVKKEEEEKETCKSFIELKVERNKNKSITDVVDGGQDEWAGVYVVRVPDGQEEQLTAL